MPLVSARFRGNPRLEAIALGDTTQYLRLNNQGGEVRAVQEALIDYGGYDIPDGATGTFGTQTAAAVVAFKTDHHFDQTDAVVGIQTLTALDDRFSLPCADREEWLEKDARPISNWNYSRFKEQTRREIGTPFTFSSVGLQVPAEFNQAIITSLEGLLDPQGSRSARSRPPRRGA